MPAVGIQRINLHEGENASTEEIGLIGDEMSAGDKGAGVPGHLAKMPRKGKAAPVRECFEMNGKRRCPVTWPSGNIRQRCRPIHHRLTVMRR